MEELFIFYQRELVGTLTRDTASQLTFTYDERWLSGDHFAISLSLPLRSEPHVDESARRFFSNLLPEGIVRQQITRRLGLSEDNDFQLLSAIGGECAGALTILTTDDAPDVLDYEYRELSSDELNQFLQMKSALPIVDGHDGLRLSLAGAQDKLPVLYEGKKLYLPVGSAPSSHILKFPNANFKHLPANETLMAHLAAEVGLPTMSTELLTDIATQPLCLIERYDRVKSGSERVSRRHQEDFCQALGIDPRRKYEAEGGPGFASCFEFVTKYSLEPLIDSRYLIDWLAFNAGVGNADGHAKNTSLLYDSQGFVRLAPFYDLVCTIAYPSISRNLAMSIGSCRQSGNLSFKHLEELATDLNVGRRFLIQRFKEQLERIVEATDVVSKRFKEQYGNLPVIQMTIPKIRKSLRKILTSVSK